ncbi:hypothetical protein AGMMS50229_13090 [Campylobacterota bacterium]|nr:hypothetical protein AGMMS50229_13090 [Campylobacterota bacterium]
MRFFSIVTSLTLAAATLMAQENAAAGEAQEEIVIPNAPIVKPSNIITIRAIGLGAAREGMTNRAQEMALAKRAAILDAYRQIGEKLHGVKISARDTVKDAMLVRSEIRTEVYSVVRGAEIVETIWDSGLCQVEMELKVDAKRWNDMFYAYLAAKQPRTVRVVAPAQRAQTPKVVEEAAN